MADHPWFRAEFREDSRGDDKIAMIRRGDGRDGPWADPGCSYMMSASDARRLAVDLMSAATGADPRPHADRWPVSPAVMREIEALGFDGESNPVSWMMARIREDHDIRVQWGETFGEQKTELAQANARIRELEAQNARPVIPIEARDNDGVLDEVIAHNPSLVHIERMDRNAWWMRIDMPDGSSVDVNFWTKRAVIEGRAERDV